MSAALSLGYFRLKMQNTYSILILEDEEPLRVLLAQTLKKKGYSVLVTCNPIEALQWVETRKVDLILLDIVLPEMDGFTFCQKVRNISSVPIIMLTAMNRPDDIVRGLDLGADEYIKKPFHFSELLVRIQSLLRRMAWTAKNASPSYVDLGTITLDDRTHIVRVNGKDTELTPIEYKLLRYLMLKPDRPIENKTLLREVWGYTGSESVSIIQSVVRRLRLKIEKDPSSPQHIVSVWGVGYKFQSQSVLENSR